MTLVAQTEFIMNTVLEEIRRTPGETLLEGGGEAVWLFLRPTETVLVDGVLVTREVTTAANVVQYAKDATGKCAISHPFPEVIEDWLEAYCANFPEPGAVTFLKSGLPTDWQYPTLP